VKLVVAEDETEALSAEVAGWDRWVTSGLAGVEVRRAVRRVADHPAARERAEAVLDVCAFLAVDEPILREAAVIAPVRLRCLDAVHLAAALSLGDDLGAFVAYDVDLARAARDHGLPVLSPGARAT
jgi:predicted nucleic acid-binding protein